MPRRCVPFVLLAVLFALPAPAGAQSSSPSVGRDKLAERVAAECRRAGVTDDATCWTGIGRRVVRSEVAAYEDSWVHEANEFQYELGNRVGFKDAPWIGTHNSANSTAYLPTLSQTDSNQQLTLAEQLRLDMRSLEIDVHWVRGEPVACHGRSSDELHAGCTSEEPARVRLAEVDAWLEKKGNGDEVLLLYIEDHLRSPGGLLPAAYEQAVAEIRDIFDGQLYAPEREGCTALPASLTRADVIAAGKQVVIVSGDSPTDCGPPSWQRIQYRWKGEVSDESGSPVAAGQCPDMKYSTHMVRKYEDSTWLSATAAGGTGGWITAEHVRKMMSCGVDLIGFDQILPFDGRLEGAVWTWADEDSIPKRGECAARLASGRWEGRACGEERRAACVTSAREWIVLADAGSRADAAAACQAAGLELGTPRTSEENTELGAAAGAGSVWLGYAKPGGKKPPKAKKR